MTTAHQIFPRQASHAVVPASGRRPWELPEPAVRRRLREQWGLTTQQVAAAFGVTPATVRSWERGRSTPRGERREAYRRFLAGLAQHNGAPVAAPEAPPKPAPPALPASTGPAAGVTLRPTRVGSPCRSADPLSPERLLRLRLLGAAACMVSLLWWLMLTCPPSS
ncbi:helix-turn-helix transcriptional regulator [Streptomyces sp. NPDC047014]|uniref:helix-turn-helix domain-containing protein n=1 Tax=Streptomyces sp. NPDC047014 TaxID=3155736 RepID=UPI00340C87DF